MATEARVRAGHRGAVWRLIAGENAFFYGQRAKFCAFQMHAARVRACELGWLKIITTVDTWRARTRLRWRRAGLGAPPGIPGARVRR